MSRPRAWSVTVPVRRFKDNDGIRGSSQPKCSGDRIKWVVGLHFANMVINNDRNAVLTSDPLQASYRCIIGAISCQLSILDRSKFLQGIDDDHHRVRHRAAPLFYILQA